MARVKVAASEAAEQTGDIDLTKISDKGEKLVEELNKADRETAISNAKVFLADVPAEKPADRRMDKLVTRTFAPLDWDKILDRFEQWMALGDKRTDEQFIRRAHEEAPEILGQIQDVYVQVKFAREAWEVDNLTMLGAMRAAASDVLEVEKAKKIRTKTITIDDVTSKAASMFPDEFAAQEKQRKRYESVENRLKYCVERGTIRCKHLDSMMHKLR